MSFNYIQQMAASGKAKQNVKQASEMFKQAAFSQIVSKAGKGLQAVGSKLNVLPNFEPRLAMPAKSIMRLGGKDKSLVSKLKDKLNSLRKKETFNYEQGKQMTSRARTAPTINELRTLGDEMNNGVLPKNNYYRNFFGDSNYYPDFNNPRKLLPHGTGVDAAGRLTAVPRYAGIGIGMDSASKGLPAISAPEALTSTGNGLRNILKNNSTFTML